MTDWVLMLSVGPVQGFIQESRRLSDLWASSHLLSELVRVAARAAGGRTVYPADLGLAALPNKVVCVVENPQRAAEQARHAVQGRWEQSCRQALSRLGDVDEQFRAIWDRQIGDFVEYQWAAVRGPDYATAFAQAASALQARKRTRLFVQRREAGPKDSLTGTREALRTAHTTAHQYWAMQAGRQRAAGRLKPGELLDAIGSVKRFALDQTFPSVSTVATASFLARAERARSLPRLTQLLDQAGVCRVDTGCSGFPYDGEFLYPETYQPERLRENYGIAPQPEALPILDDLYGEVGARPNPYYAVAFMDGDAMGDRLAECLSEDEHAELSRRLGWHAIQSRDHLRRSGATPVYVGGDDLLVLLPAAGCLGELQAVARNFTHVFSDWPHSAGKFTASAGVAIVHHRSPLDAALATARAAQRDAKRLPGKNSLVVRIMKRSGDALAVSTRWGAGLDTLNRLIEMLNGGRLSTRMCYELSSEARLDLNLQTSASLLRRLLTRHAAPGHEPEARAIHGQLLTWAEDLAGLSGSGGIEALSRWALAAVFLSEGRSLE
ncbi:MAG: type III-B CRISPR-associated protein Cas10/Cmr2 [bacterium]|nr:type III-B CRISPR-associated protein Cas10/Cmr2 [bacterium]